MWVPVLCPLMTRGKSRVQAQEHDQNQVLHHDVPRWQLQVASSQATPGELELVWVSDWGGEEEIIRWESFGEWNLAKLLWSAISLEALPYQCSNRQCYHWWLIVGSWGYLRWHARKDDGKVRRLRRCAVHKHSKTKENSCVRRRNDANLHTSCTTNRWSDSQWQISFCDWPIASAEAQHSKIGRRKVLTSAWRSCYNRY